MDPTGKLILLAQCQDEENRSSTVLLTLETLLGSRNK